jgi:heterotetrameric sarcosine oxidase delta subunit
MRIPCPFCGERDLHEFVYHGDATTRRPTTSEEVSPEQERDHYVDSIYFLDNPLGAHTGLWYHRFGCRSWLTVTRDTRSHEILSVSFAKTETAP